MDDANEYVNKVIHGQSVDQIASSNMPSVSDKEGSLKEATKTIITVPSIEPNINNTLKNEEKVKEIGPQEIKAIGDNNQNKHRFTNLLITKTPVPGSLLVKAGKAYKVLENQKLEQFSSPSRATILDQKFAKGLENMTQEELEKLKLVKDFSPRDLGYIDGLIERKRSATEEKLSM